jgi:hypothetical protein
MGCIPHAGHLQGFTMTTICIVPERRPDGVTTFHATARDQHSAGRSPGEALDALNEQLTAEESGTLVIVQQGQPDRFFTRRQQERLAELMSQWRSARDSGTSLPAALLQELESLVDAELQAAGDRAAAIAENLGQ